jgi:hypothetical protein
MADTGQPSFAETALAQAGKSAEEVRRLGAVDRADEQLERLFQPQYQTRNSPVHRAVWDWHFPLEGFRSPKPEAAECDAVLERCYEVLRRAREENRLWNEQGKVSEQLLHELAEAGYWGLLIGREYGGSGVPFAKFAPFLTRMATLDATVAGLASVHGCIGAVDPLMTFGTPEQKARFLPRLASGEALSALPDRTECGFRPDGSSHPRLPCTWRLRAFRTKTIYHERDSGACNRPGSFAGKPSRCFHCRVAGTEMTAFGSYGTDYMRWRTITITGCCSIDFLYLRRICFSRRLETGC